MPDVRRGGRRRPSRPPQRAGGRSTGVAARSPLGVWLSGEAAVARLRARIGRTPRVFSPRNREWRDVAPGWAECLALVRSGLPFQIVAERRYDRSARLRRLAAALESGATVYV